MHWFCVASLQIQPAAARYGDFLAPHPGLMSWATLCRAAKSAALWPSLCSGLEIIAESCRQRRGTLRASPGVARAAFSIVRTPVSGAEALRGGAIAVPEKRLAKLITLRRSVRLATWTCSSAVRLSLRYSRQPRPKSSVKPGRTQGRSQETNQKESFSGLGRSWPSGRRLLDDSTTTTLASSEPFPSCRVVLPSRDLKEMWFHIAATAASCCRISTLIPYWESHHALPVEWNQPRDYDPRRKKVTGGQVKGDRESPIRLRPHHEPNHPERRRAPTRFRGPAARSCCGRWVGRGKPESKDLLCCCCCLRAAASC